MYKLFSQRKEEETRDVEVWNYDEFPQAFRNQFFNIVEDLFEIINPYVCFQNGIWDDFLNKYCREKGLKGVSYGNEGDFAEYIDEVNPVDFCDIMDFVIYYVFSFELTYIEDNVQESMEELNYRLKTHSLGYEVINKKLIVKTNTFAHAKMVKPVLVLLSNDKFRGAEEEYLRAFEFYKNNDNSSAILEAVKAFESVMKIICDLNLYAYTKNDTASRLISILEKNEFFPKSLSHHLVSLKGLLESGAVTLRNKMSAHGQGSEGSIITDELVEYALNLVASNIIFLVKTHNLK